MRCRLLLRYANRLRSFAKADQIEKWLSKSFPNTYSLFRNEWGKQRRKPLYNVFNDCEKGKRRALLCYLPEAFYSDPNSLEFVEHVNRFRCLEICSVLKDLAFIVDVTHHSNGSFRPNKRYDLYIDEGRNLDRISHLLPRSCKKVLLAVGNHWLFQNMAELRRVYEIKERRGIILAPRRMVQKIFADIIVDAILITGNEFTMRTYSHVHCPIYRIPIGFPINKLSDVKGRFWLKARREFLWIGGSGAVLKGLDLVLEIFSGLPEFKLHVIGDIEREEDFFRAYKKELVETDNIHYHGFINHASDDFAAIAAECCGIVYPSASEGGCGSVVASMFRGLIPIISRETSLDVGDDGFVLADCGIETIQATVRKVAELSETELERRSRSIRNRAIHLHSDSAFYSAMRMALEEINDY